MPNANYIKGVRKERKIMNEARESGKLAFRSAGSHSPIDVVVIDQFNRQIELIQCKPESLSQFGRDKLAEKFKFLAGVYGVTFKIL